MITGLVMCGGSSTRMGTDKGLLKEGGQTWAEIAAGKLIALNLPVVVSVNEQQLPGYKQIFTKEQLIADKDIFGAKAPLFGLLSAHLQIRTKDLFVLACDIRDMTIAFMQALLEVYKRGTHEAYVYQTGERPQPLCGIYTGGGLHKIYALFQEGNLQRFSMMHALETLHTKYIPVPEESLAAFHNYNRPEEL